MDFFIKTERLTLRQFQFEDAAALNAIANSEYVLTWMPDWKSDISDTENQIKWFISRYPPATKTTALVAFAVEQNGELIGMAGIGNKAALDNELEVAYFISETHAGNGYATEAVSAAAQWAFANLETDYLIATVQMENQPSQRVAEKCGFEKIDARWLLDDGQTEEKLFYYYRRYKTARKKLICPE